MEVQIEHMSKKRIIQRPSFCSILGFSAWAMTRLINLPLEVSNPVLSANPMQHFTGGFGIITFTLLASINYLNSSS